MKICPNRDINRDHKNLPDVPKTVASAGRHEPADSATTIPHNLKRFAEKPNDEKLTITLLIVVAGIIAYQFWQKMNRISIIYNRWCCGK